MEVGYAKSEKSDSFEDRNFSFEVNGLKKISEYLMNYSVVCLFEKKRRILLNTSATKVTVEEMLPISSVKDSFFGMAEHCARATDPFCLQ